MEKKKVDRLSNLPGDVLDQILSSMPIRDAAKTSLLSAEWRNKWKSIPSLVFEDDDRYFLPDIDDPEFFSAVKTAREVDRVLLLRSGPIHNFKFTHPGTGYLADDIVRWILHLSNHPIQGLKITTSATWTMPSSAFFSWKNLTRLRLTNCRLNPPSTFRGFKSLKSLELMDVRIARDALQSLISGSPELESLELWGVDDHVVVDAPSLKSFRFCSQKFAGFGLVNCPGLEDCLVRASKIAEQRLCSVRGHNLIKLMAEAPRVRTLSFTGVAFEYLASGVIPRELPAPLVDLRCLSIDICFMHAKQITALYLLLSSVPNLQKLYIECWPSENSDDASDDREWEAGGWDQAFPHLGKILVTEFGGSPEEISFVKLMLSASPILDEMTVELGDDAFVCCDRKFEVVTQLLELERASPRAKVVVSDPSSLDEILDNFMDD